MSQVVLSLGSNIDPAFNIRKAVAELRSRYADLQISPVYESEAIGFDGDNFLNLVVVLETDVSLERLATELKQLEDRYGRDRSAPRFSGRTLDIDILSYDDLLGLHAGIELPRPEISEHAFVLQPLADLLPDTLHPGRQISYAQMWQEFDRAAQHLWQVSFDWQAGAQDFA